MMKTKTLFVCQNCGIQSPRWAGKCSGCDSWNSLVEESIAPLTDKRNRVTLKEGP
ncbi:MAG: DNA repair protein RadA, partial [Candidatus Omnitrophica bacterium]|nr:DNA repair protein RadA [Candidatus Omnitrophota bacterium]